MTGLMAVYRAPDASMDGVLADPDLAFLTPAFDPVDVANRLRPVVHALLREPVELDVRGVRILRHKPRRRCLLEFDLWIERRCGLVEAMPLLGKVGAKRLDERSYQVQTWLWNNGFSADAPDGISVPEPVGQLPELRMWLQRRAAGVSPLTILASAAGLDVARRITETGRKIHSAGFEPDRVHRMEDELRILEERLRTLARREPHRARRLENVFTGCQRIAATIEEPPPSFIHRDFYHDQLILQADRLHAVDFDLACAGDPALDMGNFLGHLMEFGLRCEDDPDAFAPVMNEIAQQFTECRSDSRAGPAIDAYVTLTVARHIEISTRFPDRRRCTEKLLDLCESRLGVAGSSRK
jgi:hypothetical protein